MNLFERIMKWGRSEQIMRQKDLFWAGSPHKRLSGEGRGHLSQDHCQGAGSKWSSEDTNKHPHGMLAQQQAESFLTKLHSPTCQSVFLTQRVFLYSLTHLFSPPHFPWTLHFILDSALLFKTKSRYLVDVPIVGNFHFFGSTHIFTACQSLKFHEILRKSKIRPFPLISVLANVEFIIAHGG